MHSVKFMEITLLKSLLGISHCYLKSILCYSFFALITFFIFLYFVNLNSMSIFDYRDFYCPTLLT